MEKDIKVSGMMCSHCEARVKSALMDVPGVEDALPSSKEGKVHIILNGDVPVYKLIDAVKAAGYDAYEE